ncbi:hypothetical protein SRABI96_03478 [Peribacillus sp. Bi96]|uniref:hypothetical protein n=1 Tax=Peribacillus sp. Bi96 TaxID=2884273 RepID=UPI001DDBC886|nr:hypothetical protein [Peribacillus sp. Bi96]CAH0262939.1 hypothetical protein SRABI96_03478 [Peribacillus sp. Bi96]
MSTTSKQLLGIAGDLIKIRPISIKNLARETISESEIVLIGSDSNRVRGFEDRTAYCVPVLKKMRRLLFKIFGMAEGNFLEHVPHIIILKHIKKPN